VDAPRAALARSGLRHGAKLREESVEKRLLKIDRRSCGVVEIGEDVDNRAADGAN
jgi:hypothetical protein